MLERDQQLRHDWLWHIGNMEGSPVIITTCTACGTIRVHQVAAVGLDTYAVVFDPCAAKQAPTAPSQAT